MVDEVRMVMLSKIIISSSSSASKFGPHHTNVCHILALNEAFVWSGFNLRQPSFVPSQNHVLLRIPIELSKSCQVEHSVCTNDIVRIAVSLVVDADCGNSWPLFEFPK